MYNADAIQEAIDRDPAIGPAEAKAIHALLRGRTGGRSKAAPEAEAVDRVTCPNDLRYDGLEGCGSGNVEGPDFESLYDCLDCGLIFGSADRPWPTMHTCGGPNFGRLTAGCPRCDELRGGAAPRRGWGRSSRYDGRVSADARHSCQESNCAPICTWGD